MIVQYKSKDSNNLNRLTLYKNYLVIGIEADMYRIIDDSNDPCLFNSRNFDIINNIEPNFWITEYGEDNERYSYPKSWNRAGFFEDYHDNVEKIKTQFWSEFEKFYK